MRNQLLTAFVIIVLVCAPSAAQTVTITGHKKVYTRAKSIVGFKKTFSIRRAIATATSPVPSRRITAAIAPISLLGLNVNKERTESQRLHEADYGVVCNEESGLTMMMWMEGAVAYSDGATKYVVVDLATGGRASVNDLFPDIPGLVGELMKKQDIGVAEAIK